MSANPQIQLKSDDSAPSSGTDAVAPPAEKARAQRHSFLDRESALGLGILGLVIAIYTFAVMAESRKAVGASATTVHSPIHQGAD